MFALHVVDLFGLAAGVFVVPFYVFTWTPTFNLIRMPPRASRRPNNEFAGPHKDEDYWRSESDEEEEGSTAEGTAPSSRRAQGQQSTAEQDDQLFDPTSDERDAAWVEKARKGRLSDAILSW